MRTRAGPVGGLVQRRLRRRFDDLRGPEGDPTPRYDRRRREIAAAIADDLATPRALAVLWDAIRSETRIRCSGSSSQSLRREVGDVEAIGALVDARERARVRRAFAEADSLRDRLLSLGVVVEDGPEGPRWRRAD